MRPRRTCVVFQVVALVILISIWGPNVHATPPPGKVLTGLEVKSPGNQSAPAGEVVVYEFLLMNMGELADAFIIGAEIESGWEYRIYSENVTNMLTYRSVMRYSPKTSYDHLEGMGTIKGNITKVFDPYEEIGIYIGVFVPRGAVPGSMGQLNMTFTSVYNRSYTTTGNVFTIALRREIQEVGSPLIGLMLASVAGIAVIVVYSNFPGKRNNRRTTR